MTDYAALAAICCLAIVSGCREIWVRNLRLGIPLTLFGALSLAAWLSPFWWS